MKAYSKLPLATLAYVLGCLALLMPAAFFANLVAIASSSAQAEAWEQDWTVVTLARDGSWGVGTDHHMSTAIAAAIRACKAMSTGASDCGAELATTRGGWVLAFRCGDYRILVSGEDLNAAEATALHREIDLKQLYASDLPTCHRILHVDPRGVATAMSPRLSGQP